MHFVSAHPGGQCCICGNQMIRRQPVNTKQTAGTQPKSSKKSVHIVPAKTSQKDMTGQRSLRFGPATGHRCSQPKRTFRRCAACIHNSASLSSSSPKNSKHQRKLSYSHSIKQWPVDIQRNNYPLPPSQSNDPLDCGRQCAYYVMADNGAVECLQVINCEEV